MFYLCALVTVRNPRGNGGDSLQVPAYNNDEVKLTLLRSMHIPQRLLPCKIKLGLISVPFESAKTQSAGSSQLYTFERRVSSHPEGLAAQFLSEGGAVCPRPPFECDILSSRGAWCWRRRFPFEGDASPRRPSGAPAPTKYRARPPRPAPRRPSGAPVHKR